MQKRLNFVVKPNLDVVATAARLCMIALHVSTSVQQRQLQLVHAKFCVKIGNFLFLNFFNGYEKMATSSLYFLIAFTAFVIILIVLEYVVKVKPNIKVGAPILVIGVILLGLGIYTSNSLVSIIGFVVAVFSLVFFPRRRRWL